MNARLKLSSRRFDVAALTSERLIEECYGVRTA